MREPENATSPSPFPPPSLYIHPPEPIIQVQNREVPIATALMPEPRMTTPGQPRRQLRGGGPEAPAENTDSGGEEHGVAGPLGLHQLLFTKTKRREKSPSNV